MKNPQTNFKIYIFNIMTEAFYYPPDNDEETNRIYYALVNRKQMLSDEISKIASWKLLVIIPLKKKLKVVKQEIRAFKWKYGDIVHVDILDL
ncbi:MAG: hypothetical protein P4L35_01990 [Ignavibacteriaceae bacterium]|nr:hypothetical protein [Ignavibacteriaceae bacterium]